MLGLSVACFVGSLWIAQATETTRCSSSSQVYGELEGVCVCTAENCRSLLPATPKLDENQAVMFTTSKDGKRFEPQILPIQPSFRSTTADFQISLDPSVQSQTLVGFGGAFTDASAINIYKMKTADQILEAYFGQGGLQYTLGRVPMASCDFSESIYSYNDHEEDFEMKHFSIAVDQEPHSHKISLIQQAIQLSSRNITLFASPWAPPQWMTVENSTLNCHIQGYPGDRYWKAWAFYFSKFLTAYSEEAGIEFWAVTTQNEPVLHFTPIAIKQWQSQRFNTTTERDWIKRDLGPTLKQDHPNVHILVMDDQKDQIHSWNAALEDPEAAQYVTGTAFHWYMDLDFMLWRNGNFDELSKKHQQYPDKILLATEACEGYLPKHLGTGSGVKLGSPKILWQRAENYARDIMGDLLHWSVGWTDWNLVLDRQGGPNWATNYVDAPIIADTEGGEEFYVQPTYL